MNATKTLAKLQSEYDAVMAQLKEESQPRKFRLVPRKPAGATDEYYYSVIYMEYIKHNNAQNDKVHRLNSAAWELYNKIIRIESMNVIRRFFIA